MDRDRRSRGCRRFGSVRHALRCAQFVRDDPQAYKWLLLALHGALQGALVCQLTTTAAPVGAVTESNEKKWLAHLNGPLTDSGEGPPPKRLMNLPELLRKAAALRKVVTKDPDGVEVTIWEHDPQSQPANKPISVSDQEIHYLDRIHTEFRNQFVHFEPMGWSIEVSGFPEIARLIARLITDILDRGWAFRHLQETTKKEMRYDLAQLSLLSINGDDPVYP